MFATQNYGSEEVRISDRFLYRCIVILSDLTALTAAWFATLWLRLALNPFFPKHLVYSDVTAAAPPLAIMLILWTLIERRQWMQPAQISGSFLKGLISVSEQAIVAGSIAIVGIYFSRQFGAELSRSFVIMLLPTSLLTLVIGRSLLTLAVQHIERQWPSIERVAILGHGDTAEQAVSALQRATANLHIVGIISSADSKLGAAGSGEAIGTTDQLAELINRQKIHRLVLSNDAMPQTELQRCIAIANRMQVSLSLYLNWPSGDVIPLPDTQFGPRLLLLRPVDRSAWQPVMKRAIDVVLSLSLLLLLSPLLLFIALFIRITSPGKALYRSTRVGRGGRHFTFLKFRSMYTNARDMRQQANANEKAGHIFKMRKDPRITAIGRILRRTSLDELPQLINVLRGEMSLVGPRPLPAEDLDPDGMSQTYAVWAEQRTNVLPGITGLWQIKGRSDLSFNEMVDLDLEYVNQWSPLGDLRILLATPVVLLTGKGAY